MSIVVVAKVAEIADLAPSIHRGRTVTIAVCRVVTEGGNAVDMLFGLPGHALLAQLPVTAGGWLHQGIGAFRAGRLHSHATAARCPCALIIAGSHGTGGMPA